MISSRYAVATLALLLVTLVPVAIHSYVGLNETDGLRVASIQPVLAGHDSAPTDRSADWGKRRLESDEWFERKYVDGGDEVVLTVARSYDYKTLYHHPELAISYHYASYTDHRTEEIAGRPGVPVHLLTNGDDAPVAAYVLHYDGRFVEDPIRFQIRTALEQLVSGRKPMTLIYARDDSKTRLGDLSKQPAIEVLFAAIDQFTTRK